MLRAHHIVCLLLAFFLCLSNAAAVGSAPPEGGMKAAREILDRRFDARISLTYSCSISTNGTLVLLSGSLVLQGDCYHAKGNGLEIYSDGHTRWTVDRESKEVYIESSTGTTEVFRYEDSVKELSLTDIRYSSANVDTSEFFFDTDSLGDEWIVTDLREE